VLFFEKLYIIIAMNHFNIKLLKLLNESSKNALFSPISLEITLQTLLQGSQGKIAKLLQYILEDQKDAAIQLEELTQRLQLLKETDQSNTILIQNLLLHIETLNLLPQFQKKIKESLGLETYQGKPFAEKINAWSTKNTAGLIPNLGDIVLNQSGYKGFMFANAFYLKAGWTNAFSPHPLKTELFKLENGEEVETTFIEQYNEDGHSKVGYFKTASFHAIQLPLKGGSLFMDIYLPNTHDGLPLLLNQVESLSSLWDWDREFEPAPYINILMPKFELDGTISLSKLAGALGLEDLFGNTYDLANMFEPKEDPLIIKHFEQLTKLKVDEQGLEGGAVTYIMGGTGSMPTNLKCLLFEANHPFLFSVKDKKSKSILFLGIYGQPPKDDSFAILRQKVREFDKFKSGVEQLSISGQFAIAAHAIEIKCNHYGCLDNAFYKWYLEELWLLIETENKTLNTESLICQEPFLDFLDTLFYLDDYPMPDDLPKEVKDALKQIKSDRSFHCYSDICFLSPHVDGLYLGFNTPPVMYYIEALLKQNLDLPLWEDFKSFTKDNSISGSAIQRFQSRTLASNPPPLIKDWTEEEVSKRSEYAKLRQLKTLAWDFTIRGNVYFCYACFLAYLKDKNYQSALTDFLSEEVKLYLNTSSIDVMKTVSKKISSIGDVDQLGIDILDSPEAKAVSIQVELIKKSRYSLYQLILNLCGSLGYIKKLEEEEENPWDYSHRSAPDCAEQLFEEAIIIPNLEHFHPYLVTKEDLLGPPIEL
jgi:serpin B